MVRDEQHDLVVYKVEKDLNLSNTSFYLEDRHLPSKKPRHSALKEKAVQGLKPIAKDVFSISTTLASTMLTQNVGLLSLLKWNSMNENVANVLTKFNKNVSHKIPHSCRELVKLMSEVLDALFGILMQNPEPEDNDTLVFKSLVNVLLMITDESSKYTKFIPSLEVYINEKFFASLAFNKLLVVLKENVYNAAMNHQDLQDAMKCLHYIFKLVVKSRELYSTMNNDSKGQEQFEELLKEVLNELVKVILFLYSIRKFLLWDHT